jgi:hypothetical protein
VQWEQNGGKCGICGDSWSDIVKVSFARTVAEFIDPDCGDKVNSARLHGLTGQYNNPMTELTLSRSQGFIHSATLSGSETSDCNETLSEL